MPYQKPQLKSMAHGVYPRVAQCTVATQRERSSYVYTGLVTHALQFVMLLMQ